MASASDPERMALHDAYRLECVRFYGAATFWFSLDNPPLESLRSAFERVQAAEAAWQKTRVPEPLMAEVEA